MKRLSIRQAFSESDMANRQLVTFSKADMRLALMTDAKARKAHLKVRDILTREWDEVISEDTGETLHFIEMRAEIP
jgi:hypothetical protein